MTVKKDAQQPRPGIFSPARGDTQEESTKTVLLKSKNDLKENGISDSDYFIYDQAGSGIRSSQQLRVDFSEFKNHTFFNSARGNVNVAFNNIINEYPFDGSRDELENYLNKLTGFEKYVLDRFPKNIGPLILSGSSKVGGDQGTLIEVKDFAGSEFPNISKDKSGKSIIAPAGKSLTLESFIYASPETNTNQIIFQKLSGSNGFTLGLSGSSSLTTASIVFGIKSGSVRLVSSASVKKSQFNHVAAVYDREVAEGLLKIYVNQELVSSSSASGLFGNIDFERSPFYIGSGSTHSEIMPGKLDFIPASTYSGALDDVRIFHAARTEQDLRLDSKRGIFASDALKLYFKFNEPTSSFGDNSVVLDSSGNSLHSKITNFTAYNRNTSSLPQAMSSEEKSFNPVLFPKLKKIVDLNESLLSSASSYDKINPNLITRLVPQHYFSEGQNFFALKEEQGTMMLPYSGSDMPGSGEIGSSQILSAILFVWAKHFDEIKIAIDQFSQLGHVGYTEESGIADNFLPYASRYFGLELPPILTDADPAQFFHGENVTNQYVNIERSLQDIRNRLLRRMLENARDITNSKGTVNSVRSILNSLGLDPDIIVRIKEYGGPKSFSLSENRTKRAAIQPMLKFTGSFFNRDSSSVDAQGFSDNSPRIVGSYLSSSRNTVGYPEPRGSFTDRRTEKYGIHGIASNTSDGLMTSGSWTYEGLYRFPNVRTGSIVLTQSLARLHVTGTQLSTKQGLIANVVAMSGSKSKMALYVRTNNAAASATSKPPLSLILTGVNIFDGDRWNVSFGRYRNDDPKLKSYTSSSYFLRCAKQINGRVDRVYKAKAFYEEAPASNVLQNVSSVNTSGSFVVVGSQSIDRSPNIFLNATDITSDARTTDFTGEISNIRFYSMGLTQPEWEEHVRNFTSVGVSDPLKNFSFASSPTGSFERLRMDVSIDQPISSSDAQGKITLIDFSQNNLTGSAAGFEKSKSLFRYEKVFFSSISPFFDEMESDTKVRPRSFISSSNVAEYNARRAPLHDIPLNEEPQDDPRFSLDFSVAAALNEDIVTIFSTLDEIDNAIGAPELMFSQDYPALENLRDIYFNKLTEKVNFKEFLQFFRWFDKSIGNVVDQVLPKKTKFLGTNFVIEPHSLERGKVQYQFKDQYVGESFRSDLKGVILLRQIVGRLGRF